MADRQRLSRGSWHQWFAALLAGLALVAVVGTPASADDNTTSIHWHNRPVEYHIGTSIPSDWRTPIRSAAAEWTRDTPLDFTYMGLINLTDWTREHVRLVWRGQIPNIAHSGCPPATTLACTLTRTLGDHIYDSDMVFNSDKSMGTSDFNCNFVGPFTVDVETVALHEFGHFGHLGHTTDGQAVMVGQYVTCRRSLHAHDDESMTTQYQGH